MKTGFSNWQKQFEYVKQHEESQTHINAKIAHVMFLQNMTLNDILAFQEELQEKERKKNIESNRKIMQH